MVYLCVKNLLVDLIRKIYEFVEYILVLLLGLDVFVREATDALSWRIN
jgi:hypothetical protein